MARHMTVGLIIIFLRSKTWKQEAVAGDARGGFGGGGNRSGGGNRGSR